MKKKADNHSTKLIPTKREQNKAELEQLILRCVVMRLTEKESLAYVKSNYKAIESSRYYEIKKSINDKIILEGYKITSENGLYEQHMMRIHTLETIEAEQWVIYKSIKIDDDKKDTDSRDKALKSAILERIQNLQVYLSSAYDYIRAIIKNQKDLQLVIAKQGLMKLESK